MYNVTVNRTLNYNYIVNGSLIDNRSPATGCRRPKVDDLAKRYAQFPGAVFWGSVWMCRSPSCDSFYSCGNYGDGIRSCPIILQCFRTFVIACVRMFDQPVCHSNKPMFGTEVTGASFVSARRHPVFADDSLTDTKILWTFFDWRKVPVAFDPLPDSSGNLFGGFRLYGSTIRSAQLLPDETYRSSIDAGFLDAPLHVSPGMLWYPFGKAK